MPRKSLWPWFAGMSGIVLSAAWLFIDAPAGFATGVSANQSSSTERSVAMDRTKFWKIIEHTKPLEADSDAQAAALRTELDRLAPVQIVAFEATFDHGDEGYGLWLDPAVAKDAVYSEHWAGHRAVSVTVEPDAITIRRVEADGSNSENGD